MPSLPRVSALASHATPLSAPGTGEGGTAVATPYLAPALLDAVNPASPRHSAQVLPSGRTRLRVVLLYLHVVLSPPPNG